MPVLQNSFFTNAVIILQARGYRHIFHLCENKLHCPKEDIYLTAHEFDIPEMYYFATHNKTPYERAIYTFEAGKHCIMALLLIPGSEHVCVLPAMLNKKLQEAILICRKPFDNGML